MRLILAVHDPDAAMCSIRCCDTEMSGMRAAKTMREAGTRPIELSRAARHQGHDVPHNDQNLSSFDHVSQCEAIAGRISHCTVASFCIPCAELGRAQSCHVVATAAPETQNLIQGIQPR